MTDQEITIALAEHVMGWTRKEQPGEMTIWQDETKYPRLARSISGKFLTGPWHPLTDWNDMEMVIEAMRKDGLDFALEADNATVPWFAMFGENLSHGITADTAPRAVCLAALKAVGIDSQVPGLEQKP